MIYTFNVKYGILDFMKVWGYREGFTFADPEVWIFRAYRSVFGPYLRALNAVEQDHHDQQDSFMTEDSRSFRYIVRQSHKMLSLVSVPLMYMHYPVHFMNVPTSGGRQINVMWTVPYSVLDDSIWTIHLIFITGKQEPTYITAVYGKLQ